MLFLVPLLIIAIVIFIAYNMSDKSEELIILKLIGYWLLGTFKFVINGLPIPLGFIIYLFMKPKQNVTAKRFAAIAGLIGMILGMSL